SRLEECYKPEHLESWGTIISDKLESAIEILACGDTKHASAWVTPLSEMKEHAWHWALAIGFSDVFQWLGTAVELETSPYVQHEIMMIASCLAFPIIPPVVAKFVTEEYENKRDDGGLLFPRLGATEIVHSSAARRALSLLLKTGFTVNGKPLLSTAR